MAIARVQSLTNSSTAIMARRFSLADLPIETARLALRRFRMSDAAALLALYDDPDVEEWAARAEVG